MSYVFPNFIRDRIVANQSLFHGATLGVALYYRAPLFNTQDARYTDVQTLANLNAKLGWAQTDVEGYPINPTETVFIRLVSSGAKTSSYVMMSEFPLDADLAPVEIRAVAFYYIGTLNSVVNPVVLISSTPFQPSLILRGGDSIAPRGDTTLGASNNQWLFGWDNANPTYSPEYEPPHTQHVWMYPQRVNFITNPSFEGGITGWRSNGTGAQVAIGDPSGGVKAAKFSGATPIVVESNVFPALKPRFTIQMLISGEGQAKVGLVTWPVEYDETVVDWGTETWDLTPDAFIHVQALRSAAQPYEGQLRIEASGSTLTINNVLVENEYLLDWPYFDGDSKYGNRDDFSWYGGENLKGKTYSLWYNNKRAIAGRLFATALPDRALLTSDEVLKDGLVYKWIPAGVLVEPHWDVLFPGDLHHSLPAIAPPVNAYKVAAPGTPEWGADMGVASPWPEP
jgi:hypothetical protein